MYIKSTYKAQLNELVISMLVRKKDSKLDLVSYEKC